MYLLEHSTPPTCPFQKRHGFPHFFNVSNIFNAKAQPERAIPPIYDSGKIYSKRRFNNGMRTIILYSSPLVPSNTVCLLNLLRGDLLHSVCEKTPFWGRMFREIFLSPSSVIPSHAHTPLVSLSIHAKAQVIAHPRAVIVDLGQRFPSGPSFPQAAPGPTPPACGAPDIADPARAAGARACGDCRPRRRSQRTAETPTSLCRGTDSTHDVPRH